MTRTVRNASGNVIHKNTWNSQYKKLDGLTMVGRYKDDPPAGTRILKSDYPEHPEPPEPPEN